MFRQFLQFFKEITWLKLAKITLILIAIYISVLFSICLFKYYTFQYNGLDLAIYNQVFYNSSFGRLFEFSIHPTSYLGDHFELIIFFLLPFYTVVKHPLTLLFLQACFLGFSAIPLYLIAKNHLTPKVALMAILLYLFNPLTFNIPLYEFHILAIAPFFLFWTFYFFDRNKFWPFFVFCCLSLLIREDVSFFIFMFSPLALLDKKSLKWILTPAVLAAFYFLTLLQIAPYVSALHSYKFLVYYYWLGNTPWEIFINFFLKFPMVLQHTLTFDNFELVFGFFMVFLFIPLVRAKYLLLSLGTFMQMILGSFATGAHIKSHYGTIFLIAFTLAAIFSLKALAENKKIHKINLQYRGLLPIIFICCLIYILLAFGPFFTFAKTLAITDYNQVKLKADFIRQIPANASLIAPYDLIANLSSRPYLYGLNYAFLKRQQFNAGEFIIPEDTQYLLVNFDDFIIFDLQFAFKYPEYYYNGAEVLNELLVKNNFKLIAIDKNLALWQKNDNQQFDLYQVYEKNKEPEIEFSKTQLLQNKIEFLGYNIEQNRTSLYFKALTAVDRNYFIKINNHLYPLGYGLYPTSDWQPEQVISLNFYNLALINNAEVISFMGGLELDNIGSIRPIFDKTEVLGQLDL